MADVLVVGGGMAGAIAALSAKKAGARVMVVRRALGATALSSGAIDVATDPTALPGELAAHLIPPEEAARQVARRRPDHPYAVLSAQLPRLGEALRFAADALPELLAPPSGKNALLPTPVGTVKPAAMAQRAQLAADVATLPERVAVVELLVTQAYDGRLIAGGLQAAAAALQKPLAVTVVQSRFFGKVEDALRPAYELAERLDAPGAPEGLAEDLKHVLPQDAQAVVLPPILGRARPDFAARLSAALGGLPCVELLSTAPSVPGIRLQESLDRAIEKAGIERLEAEVVRREGLSFATGEGKALRADAVVLATGKYIGGGIVRRERFIEPVLGLPVYAEGQWLDAQYVGDLLSDQLQDEQVAFRAGVRIDAALRPLGRDGLPAHAKIYAAGSVISGYDPAWDKTGLGVAIFTGYLAGEAAARSGA